MARRLYAVDAETGEALDECPSCAERQLQLDELTRKYHGALGQIGRLRKDREAEAREHKLFPAGVSVFRYYQELSGHERAVFTGERFWMLQPFLSQEDGAEGCREAIRGCLSSDFHMKRGAYANRKGPVHDGFDLIFRSQEKFEAFRQMAPHEPETITKATLEELAVDIAGRILERAKLIEEASDPGALVELLYEVRRHIQEWVDTPYRYEA